MKTKTTLGLLSMAMLSTTFFSANVSAKMSDCQDRQPASLILTGVQLYNFSKSEKAQELKDALASKVSEYHEKFTNKKGPQDESDPQEIISPKESNEVENVVASAQHIVEDLEGKKELGHEVSKEEKEAAEEIAQKKSELEKELESLKEQLANKDTQVKCYKDKQSDLEAEVEKLISKNKEIALRMSKLEEKKQEKKSDDIVKVETEKKREPSAQAMAIAKLLLGMQMQAQPQQQIQQPIQGPYSNMTVIPKVDWGMQNDNSNMMQMMMFSMQLQMLNNLQSNNSHRMVDMYANPNSFIQRPSGYATDSYMGELPYSVHSTNMMMYSGAQNPMNTASEQVPQGFNFSRFPANSKVIW